jgi:hypothetical protein
MRDVQNLVATGRNTLYIEKWTKELGLSKLWQEAQQ